MAAEGPAAEATVKWFNPEKGFGFAELADGSGDAFLHIAALQAAGHDTVQPGAKLRVNIGQGAKGPQITRVLEVDESTATPPPRRSAQGGGGSPRYAPDPSTAVDMVGTVKWFNADKGFGFVACDDGGKDVFLHVSVLQKSGVAQLAEGQRVAMGVVDTPKGREAVSISLNG
jgi:CspA family cold shock protein